MIHEVTQWADRYKPFGAERANEFERGAASRVMRHRSPFYVRPPGPANIQEISPFMIVL